MKCDGVNHFFKLCFQAKHIFLHKRLNPRQLLLLFDFPCIFRFLSLHFSMFFFCLFFSSFNVFCIPPLIKKTMILSKYHSNMRLKQDHQIAVSISKKNIDLACASQSYRLKLFGLYPKQLGISNCMRNFLEDSLLC